MPFLFPALLPAIVQPAPSPRPPSLEAALAALASHARGRLGVGLLLLETGESAWLHGDGRFPMQSVYKLPIGMATLAAVDRGALSLDQVARVRRSECIGPGQHSPIRDAHPEGDFDMTVGELLRFAVAESDGTASDVLLRLLGGPAQVMAYLRILEIPNLRVRDTEMTLGLDPSAQYRNWATPRGAVALLKALQEGRGLSASSHAHLMKLLTESAPGPMRIKGLLPAGTAVAHKTGTSGSSGGRTAATNDIGLITLPDGRHLAVAIFLRDAKGSTAEREAILARAARLGWDRWARGAEPPPLHSGHP